MDECQGDSAHAFAAFGVASPTVRNAHAAQPRRGAASDCNGLLADQLTAAAR